MPVYKDKKRGTWYVSYNFKELPSGTTKHKCKRGFKTSKDAKQWERENYSPVHVKTTKTFKDLAIEWEANNQASPESRRHYSEHDRFRLNDTFDKPVDTITKIDLVAWRNWLIGLKYSTKTKNDTITYVRSVLTFGSIMYGYPNESIILKRVKRTNKEIMSEMQTWDTDEFDKFIHAVDDPLYHTLFSFLFWTGCRRGEVIALQRKDVVNGKVFIQYSQRTAKVGLTPTKTGQKRWIALDDKLYRSILRLMDNGVQSGYVFCNNDGTSLSCTKIDAQFKKAISLSGVKKIRIHDLRHSHATWLINNGVNIVAVSKRLGHSTIDQTLKTYTHLMAQSDNEMMECINAANTDNSNYLTDVSRKIKNPYSRAF